MFRIRIKEKWGATVLLVVVFCLGLSGTIRAEQVDKERWMEAMQRDLPVTFCKSMEFFQQCFDINEEQCLQAASLASRLCLHSYETRIPDILQQPGEGARWSNIVGQCVGENFFETMKRKYKNTTECEQMNFWN